MILANMKGNQDRLIVLIFILPMWMNFLLRTYAWVGILEDTGTDSGNAVGKSDFNDTLVVREYAVSERSKLRIRSELNAYKAVSRGERAVSNLSYGRRNCNMSNTCAAECAITYSLNTFLELYSFEIGTRHKHSVTDISKSCRKNNVRQFCFDILMRFP